MTLATAVALAACTGGDGSGPLPRDPLGVVDELGRSEAAALVAWESCEITGGRTGTRSDEVRSVAGLFDPAREVGFSESERRIMAADDGDPNDVVEQAVARDAVMRTRRVGGPFGLDEWRAPAAWPTPTSPHPASLLTIEAAVASFGLDRVPGVQLTDAGGRTFTRFEALPADWRDAGDDPQAPLFDGGQLRHPYTNVVWVLDVWSDDDGRIDRLRSMTAEAPDRWSELRFVDADPWPAADVDRCPQHESAIDAPWFGPERWTPARSVPLAVSVDASGRPYDVHIPTGTSIEEEALTTIVAPGGRIAVADGISLGVALTPYDEAELRTVDFADAVDDDGIARLGVTIIWEVWEAGESGRRVPLGVRIDDSDGTVERWADWEYAYGTDGGMGGVVTRSVLERATEENWDVDGSPISEEVLDRLDEDTLVWDLDGIPGDDLLIYGNGFGDGAFPMARGFDAGGRLVSLVLWDDRYPWRLAVPDGLPPPIVTDREREFEECIDGRRQVAPDGSCPTDL